MSTLWYGKHAAEVIAVEDYQPWFEKVSSKAKDRKNVHLQFARDKAEYLNPAINGAFDLIIVDGN